MNIPFEEHSMQILDAVPDGVLIVDAGGSILFVNQAMERITGYSRAELSQAPCTVLNCDVCQILRSETRTAWCRLFEAGEVRDKRCTIMRKDGTYASMKKSGQVLKDPSGAAVGAVEIYADLAAVEIRDRKIEELASRLQTGEGFHGMVGQSLAMQRVYGMVDKVAGSDAPILITGESGTGKEMLARAVHERGLRAEGPFISLNCAALNEALLESELFGHTKGAFTGAYRHREGRFEAAHGGDIFLDEIGDMPMSVQTKLLRVLETKQFERVGENRPVNVDVRIITATNRNLQDLIARGEFREDLFFRINVVPMHLPPLRERREDIPELTNHFIRGFVAKTGKKIAGVSPEVMGLFLSHAWPGNIRELKSTLEYAFVVADSGRIVRAYLPGTFARPEPGRPAPSGFRAARPGRPPGAEPQPGDPPEKAELVRALGEAGGNRSQAARLLGVHRMTVWNRMRKYGLAGLAGPWNE